MTDATPARRPFLNGWDALEAVLLGVIAFVIGLFHQELLWVNLLVSAVLAVTCLFLLPLMHRIRDR